MSIRRGQEDTCTVRCYNPDEIDVRFDDERLVADAGLLLPATLAVGLGLRELLDAHVDLGKAPGAAHAGDKAMTMVHSLLAGGSWIDDCDRLRAGVTGSVLGHRVLAPSTVGTFLRSFTFGHARQLDRVSLAALQRAWQAGAGPGAAPLTIDVDSTICEVYGTRKQGAAFGHTKVRGYHPLLAFAAGSWDLLHARLRGGNAYTARGAAGFVAETIGRVRAAGASGPLTLRADSGFYARTVVAVCQRHQVRFSITVKLNKAVRKAIAAIPEQAWTPIGYWLEGGADVAETSYRPFGKKGPLTRLIVRRVRPTPGSQLALFTDYAYHPFITDRQGTTLELEADHRRHAEVEPAICDLKAGAGLAHLPSGRFGANAAWLGLCGIAYNLGRWTSRLGLGEGRMSPKTLRVRYLALPGRLAVSARRPILHLPARWPWRWRWEFALARLRCIPHPT
jgi:Transposase DDE domain group 1